MSGQAYGVKRNSAKTGAPFTIHAIDSISRDYITVSDSMDGKPKNVRIHKSEFRGIFATLAEAEAVAALASAQFKSSSAEIESLKRIRDEVEKAWRVAVHTRIKVIDSIFAEAQKNGVKT